MKRAKIKGFHPLAALHLLLCYDYRRKNRKTETPKNTWVGPRHLETNMAKKSEIGVLLNELKCLKWSISGLCETRETGQKILKRTSQNKTLKSCK